MKKKLHSYSSIRSFLDCPRMWAYKYIDEVELEFSGSVAMDKGKMFHELVEAENAIMPMADNGLSLFDTAIVRSAAKKYLDMAHTLPKPTKREVKIINEEKQFIGFADSITINDDNSWLIGEMKTSSRFDPVEWAINQVSMQTALYKVMSKPWCAENFLSQNDFQGVSFKKIILSAKKPLKGRGKSAVPETLEQYEERIKDDAKVYHQIFAVSEAQERCAIQTYDYVLASIKNLGEKSDAYPKCNNRCKTAYGVCDYFEHCWGFGFDTQEEGSIDYDE